MKRNPFFLILIPLSLLGAYTASLLSPEKQTLLKYQQEIYESEHQKLRYNWISPLNLNAIYDYDKSAQGGYHSDTETLSASISQDIFRSGGITYQIKYADAKKQSETIRLQKDIALYNQQLFISLLNYQKNSVLLDQSMKRLENKEIEVFIKRQLYDAGKVDITELNNALMGKSVEQKSVASLKYSLAEQRYEIAKLSDINPESFPLPRFDLIGKEQFVEHQFDVEYSRAQADTLKNLSGVTSSRYLPILSLIGDVGYRRYDPQELSGYSGNYYSAGVQLTLPLTYNASATIQEAQATYLKENATIADKKRELDAAYAQVIEKIESYRESIAITSENLILYNDLLRAIEAGVNAGTKTGYDLQTLKNTKAIEELEITINEINIQILLAQLHFALNPSKELL
ncbi:MAG: TolC family protein [Sulfuricurvum sp.]|uniref:TolC family protein n=1 Tax=Sulfuricurvum sp. TaxID=2025608 RepID=UPI00273592C1|nr:TolC family protein [Sulfuricurvum sp.]MDP2851712.1 TolC family protein [Sulfuricurvum sp.]